MAWLRHYFESARLPFIVAVNGFHGDYPHDLPDGQDALTTLVEHAMAMQLRPS